MISCYNIFCVFNKEESCDNEDAPIIGENGNCMFCVMTELPESVERIQKTAA